MTQEMIWEDGSFREDSFSPFVEGEQASGDLVLTFEQFEAQDWSSHDGRLGLAVRAEDDIEAVSKVLERFELVAVHFPKFADGRAFSIARLIRDKYAFSGEIRATGAYILDQMPMLQRCGVTTFEVTSDAVKAGLSRGAWPNIPHYYQVALDGEGNHARTRSVDVKRPWISVDISEELAAELSAA